jgi:membrane protein DedA with SNARE-associated domain
VIWIVVLLLLGAILFFNYPYMTKDDLWAYAIAMLVAIFMLIIRSLRIER